jgi:hypothetical protein
MGTPFHFVSGVTGAVQELWVIACIAAP